MQYWACLNDYFYVCLNFQKHLIWTFHYTILYCWFLNLKIFLNFLLISQSSIFHTSWLQFSSFLIYFPTLSLRLFLLYLHQNDSCILEDFMLYHLEIKVFYCLNIVIVRRNHYFLQTFHFLLMVISSYCQLNFFSFCFYCLIQGLDFYFRTSFLQFCRYLLLPHT